MTTTINDLPSGMYRGSAVKDMFKTPQNKGSAPFVGPVMPPTPVRRYTPSAAAAPAPQPTPQPSGFEAEVQAALQNPNLASLATPPAATPQAPAPVVVESPVKNPIAEYYESLDRTAPTADEQAKIREDARVSMQAYIDAVNNEYAGLISREQEAGVGRVGQTRAINARSGLLGSDFGTANVAETERYNAEAVKALERERATKIAEINTKIDQRAKDDIEAQTNEAKANAADYVARLERNQEAARNDIKSLAKSGASFDSDKLETLRKQSGYDPLTFESIFNANKPTPEYRAPVQLKDGTLIMTDSAGNVKNLGKYDLPEQHRFLFAPDGTPFVVDETTGEAQIASGFHKGQFRAPSSGSTTASQKEYEYAVSQGFEGTFLDYKKELATLDSEDLAYD